MMQRAVELLPDLYEADETSWLETMAQLIREGRTGDLDFPHLQEYLEDMARRDRREVLSRLSILISHLLKWNFQTERRSNSWRATIEVQRQELAELLESGVLRNFAQEVLQKAYVNGMRQAVAETALPAETFPGECPYSLDNLLTEELDATS